MKKKGLIMLGLITILLLASITPGCGLFGGVKKPSVGYVPQDWYRYEDISYGEIVDNAGLEWGLITYVDEVDWDAVNIFYGDVPSILQGNENDSAALIAYAVECSLVFVPQETGTMVVAGHLAGYTRTHDATNAWYEMEIIFVEGSTCIDIYTIFDDNAADEAQVMSLINSIDF
ncbi:MAG TPA: hypothetical protein G4N91_00595 [Dehalococcoidia bacterium]|nr:hypothetical protein [Dehalococcoidia bacterium]